MAKELTKVEKFEMVKELVKNNEMLVDFIDNEITLINNRYAKKSEKASAKSLANRKENDEKLAIIIDVLRENGESMTIKELATYIPNDDGTLPTSSKVSAIMKPALTEGKIVRTIKSKTRYYSLV